MFQFYQHPGQRQPANPNQNKRKRNNSTQKDPLIDPFCSVLFISTLTAVLVRLLIGHVPIAQVGDTLQFRSGDMTVVAADMEIPGHLIGEPWDRPGRSCNLNVPQMTMPGGALTVDAVRRDGVILSWAGKQTAAGKADCGRNTEIFVDNDDYNRLVSSQAPIANRPYR